MTRPTLGATLRRLRSSRGLTLADLAGKSGCGVGQLSGFENGHATPHPSTIRRLAAALAVDPSVFLQEPAMLTAAPTGYLSLEQTAHELETTALAVQRLICRQRIPASRLGRDGAWRIAASALGAYIGSGCPDLAMPEHNSTWFISDDGEIHMVAFRFQEALFAACSDQIPPQSQTPATQPGQPFIRLNVTPRVTAACQTPAPSPWPERGAASAVDVREVYLALALRAAAVDVREVYLAMTLRAAARLSARDPNIGTLAQLYESPEAYATLVKAATVRVLATAVTTTSTHLNGDRQWEGYTFGMPHASLAPAPALDVATFLAF